MPILDRLMKASNKQQVTKIETKPSNKPDVKKPANKLETKTSNKPETKQQAQKQKTLGPAQLAAIAAVSGQAEADRLQALLEGGQAQLAEANKPAAIKHLADVVSPEPGFALTVKFLNPDEKPSRKELEASIAGWYLSQKRAIPSEIDLKPPVLNPSDVQFS
ncbi:hypothetical protein [Pseudomonas sp.]|uniref:hypothetical protein n=1 Tax=Pseudomonas sp. TaxID=306 RepID=UPI00257B7A98|nr:hypothetical protein [Pseudomonas sp.]